MIMKPKSIRLLYRAANHAPLWLTIEKAGIFAKHGLEMEITAGFVRQKAVDLLTRGEVDMISGNHHNLYPRRAKRGEPFVHLAQTVNDWLENQMVVAPGIEKIEDLKGKRVVMDDFTTHKGLNVWLYLRLHGLDAEKGDVELVSKKAKTEEHWRAVMANEYQATFLAPPDDLRARKAGATVLEVPQMAMIRGATITTTIPYVQEHEDEVRRMMKCLVEGIHYFRSRRTETLKILKNHCADLLNLTTDKEVEHLYERYASAYEPKLYPTMDAIRNVFQLALRKNPEISDFNPLILWDLHYVREIDDQRFLETLN